MFDYILKHGLHVTVALLILCTLGIVSASRLPLQMIPDLDPRVISIRTTWPGATPQDVEKEILVEQEEYLRNLPNLSRISSTASTGQAQIELEFPWGTDITEMLIRVNNALSQVPGYGENVDEPRIYASSFSSNSFMFFVVAPLADAEQPADINLSLDFVEDNVRPRLSSVPGVSEISVYGGVEREIQILVDPAELAARQLTLADVRNALRARNRDRSAGEVESGKRRYLLRTVGRFQDVAELEQLILARRGVASVYLADVATVRIDHAEKRSRGAVDGDEILFITVRREAGSNVIAIKESMLAEVERVNRELLNPIGLRIYLMADDVGYVQSSVANVWLNLGLGALLATLVMFLFLRSGRMTAVGVIGIPVCTIAAFLGLALFGRTINVISLAGIAFAIGMTLDNTIVVLESIELERKRGKKLLEAALTGVSQVWPAVLASTLTTILVFLPVAFVEQEAGQLYSDIAIAISSAILASMLVAITVVPTAIASLPQKMGASDLASSGSYAKWESTIYRGLKRLLSTSPRRVGTLLIAIIASGYVFLVLTPPAEYLPEGEEPKVFVAMSAPPGYNLATMDEIAKDLESYFMPFTRDQPERFERGESPVPAMKYLNMRIQPESIRIISEPKDPKYTDALLESIIEKYKQYPGMRAFGSRGSIITSNNGGTRSINVDISGSDLDQLYGAALTMYRRAQTVFDNPRIQTDPSSLTLAQPLVEVRPNWQRAAEAGLNAETLGLTVAALTNGSYVDEFFISDDKVDIWMYSTAGQAADLDSLPDLPVYTESGNVVPLSALASIEETVSTSSLRRVNGQRTVTLRIIPPESIALERGVAMVQSQVVQHMRDEGSLPNELSVAISGAADQLQETREALIGNYAVALLIVYFLLVAIFGHWGYPLLIMTTIPLGVAGGIVGLRLMNWVGVQQAFDMISMLGFLILMGTVVNNPILIVHRAVANVKTLSMDAIEAVLEATQARLRPIAMSTITTLAGLLPLVVVPGAGTELYRGVGVIVMFGILGAAIVTLTVLPILTAMVLQRIGQR